MRALTGCVRRALLTLLGGLPFLVALPAVAQVITDAQYTTPTRAYPHGVLGDEEEWANLRVKLKRQKGEQGDLFHGQVTVSYDIAAPDDMVFEDTAPRLWDVDGDGNPEVVIVISHQDYGAQLAVLGYRDGAFSYIATTPTIGQRFRWLAPVAAADMDGDGAIEIGFVHTPHLGKTLHVWRYRDGDFVPVAQRSGLTNHRIGWDFIAGGLRDCENGPEFVTANANWSRIIASRLVANRIETRDLAAYTGPDSLNAALQCS